MREKSGTVRPGTMTCMEILVSRAGYSADNHRLGLRRESGQEALSR